MGNDSTLRFIYALSVSSLVGLNISNISSVYFKVKAYTVVLVLLHSTLPLLIFFTLSNCLPFLWESVVTIVSRDLRICFLVWQVRVFSQDNRTQKNKLRNREELKNNNKYDNVFLSGDIKLVETKSWKSFVNTGHDFFLVFLIDFLHSIILYRPINWFQWVGEKISTLADHVESWRNILL